MLLFAAALLTAALPLDIKLAPSPRHVYKQADGRATERFGFALVVRGDSGAPSMMRLELRAGTQVIKVVRYNAEALAALREKPGKLSADADASYLVRLAFDEPAAEKIDAVALRFDTSSGGAALDVPVAEYAQKTKLSFPLRGDFVAVSPDEPGAGFAYDVVPLGAEGVEVLAPAAGRVVYARNDAGDMPATAGDDPAGNAVVIDHGNGEWSLLARLAKGSLKIKRGDIVKPGQPIAGSAPRLRLRYQLMAGPKPLVSDGLPARFGNTCQPAPTPGVPCDAR